MSYYNRPKRDFNDELRERADQENISIDQTGFPAFQLENGVTANVRATVQQPNPINFNVDQEIQFIRSNDRDDNIDVFLVILDLRNRCEFDPSKDHFYPIPERILTNGDFVTRKPSDGHQLLKIDLRKPPVRKWKDDWSALFEPTEGFSNQAGNDPGFGPDDPNGSPLQEIARKYES